MQPEAVLLKGAENAFDWYSAGADGILELEDLLVVTQIHCNRPKISRTIKTKGQKYPPESSLQSFLAWKISQVTQRNTTALLPSN